MSAVFRLSRRPVVGDTFYDLGVLRYALRLHSFALHKRLDLLHFHYADFIPSSILLRSLDKIPIIVTLHWFPWEYLSAKHSNILSIHQYLMFAYGLRMATRVVAPSKYVSDLVERKLGVRSIVIPNAICLNEYRCLPSREKAREAFCLNAKDVVLVNVGRLDVQKGITYLIRSFQKIVAECPSAKLLVAGTGPLKYELPKLVEELHLRNVVFTGYLEEHKRRQLLAAADIYVAPSVWESFGIAVLEALAAGLPIVATSVGGIPEIVEEGKNGFLVPPRNPAALSRAVLDMISDESARANFGENNKRKAEKYSTESVFPQILDVYEESISRR